MITVESSNNFGFSLKPHSCPKHYLGEATAQLVRDGAVVRQSIPGVDLERVITVDDCWLLFITYNTPFEEQLDIQLLTASAQPLERITLCSVYSTGQLSGLKQVDDHCCDFSFFADVSYRLKVHPEPIWRLPLIGDPAGVRLRTALRTRLSITQSLNCDRER